MAYDEHPGPAALLSACVHQLLRSASHELTLLARAEPGAFVAGRAARGSRVSTFTGAVLPDRAALPLAV